MIKPIWTPSAERVGHSNLQRFMQQVGQTDFKRLYGWSIECPDEFWRTVWEFVGIQACRQPEAVVEGIDRMPGARWFPGARLNFAENLLRYCDNQQALVFWNEHGRQRSVTYRQLHELVSCTALALSRAGVLQGDRVAGLLPNMPETVVAMLATTSQGALWSSCSPDFGVEGVVARFGQIEPKVLFTADGYWYNGKHFDCIQRAQQVADRIDSIQQIVVIPYATESPDIKGFDQAVLYEDFLLPADSLEFASLPFDHPAYILFSSGTTGVPKCIIHGAGGTLIQHLKELVLHTDLTRDDRIFYFTSCGWMMWNWLMSSLAVGATIVLYDGSPLQPTAGRLFDMAEQEQVTVFGTSAKYLAAIEKEGLVPARTHDLQRLRSILSTGSPLAPTSFDYVYRKVKSDVCLSSISGGTDLVSCFALGNPAGSVYRGELQTAGLGMRGEVFDENGQPLSVGVKGELVCTLPFPSMPVGFWNDPDGSQYHGTYFERFPGAWHHGDYCERTPNGGYIIWGRSDTALNPGGVRIGTAEIYSAVEAMGEVVEAVAVAQEQDNDVQIVLFVRLRNSLSLDEGLIRRIKQEIRNRASPRHVPARVIQVQDIPRTRSGKIAELAVRDALHGRPVINREALANPESLHLFVEPPELRT